MDSSAARQACPRFDRDANLAMRTNYPGINDPLLSMKSSRTWMVEMILAVWKLHRFRPLSVGDLGAAWRNCGDRLICIVDSCSRIEGDSPQDLYGNPVDRDARTARSSTMACSRRRYRSVVRFQPGYQSSNFSAPAWYASFMVEAGRVFDKALSFRNSDQMAHDAGVVDFKPVVSKTKKAKYT